MCGIVGLLVKNPSMRDKLGQMMVPMLIGMSGRGPDSAGLAVFGQPVEDGRRKLSVYADGARLQGSYDWSALIEALNRQLDRDATVAIKGIHGIITFVGTVEPVKQWIIEHDATLKIFSSGRRIDLYKDVGTPAEVSDRYGFSSFTGTHLVGHTRMATESAVTPDRAHPFTAGDDFCLVHNGSLSNHHDIRRMLEPRGIHFDTDNDTEAATRFLEWRLREGDTLEQAITQGFDALDGFYTLLMGTATELALVRDPFACKPAVVAETDDYVAIASEFRSLAHLPGVNQAHVFEPSPAEMYVWKA